MVCHVHPGWETCLECEPGNVAPANVTKHLAGQMSTKERERARKKELSRLKSKFRVHGDPKLTPNQFQDR